MPKKVIILGAGVGGLTVAHELIQCAQDKYEIHIYEKNNIIGGMARSSFKDRNGTKLPTEYCWRIYGPNYYNLREILKQIPIKNSNGKTVHDNLVDMNNYLIADQHTVLTMNNRFTTLWKMRKAFKHISWKEKYKVLSKIFYCFMISNNRLNDLDKMSWSEYINPNNSLSHDMEKYIVNIMGPYLGAEPLKVNVPSVAITLESFKMFNHPLGVMNGPTNEAWFDHWKIYLEEKDVYFHLNSKVVDISIKNKEVEAIILDSGQEIKADLFFCSLPIESVANLPSLSNTRYKDLAKNSYQLMVGIQLYFNKKIILPFKVTGLFIPDSPWQLVIEPQGSIWNKSYGDVADFWSIGLCDPIHNGLLIKKPFIECSHEEIQQEVWYQIKNSEFGSYLHLNEIEVIDYNVWNTYVFDGNKIVTDEPKFSTNKNTYFLRPDNQTEYKNLFFATGYTKTETNMFEMESAAESGRRAAKIIEKSVPFIKNPRPLFFKPYRKLDSLVFSLNLYQSFSFLFFILGLPFVIMYNLWISLWGIKINLQKKEK